jgi:colanic acid/amylovoran biosynthesis glycosyltransferase
MRTEVKQQGMKPRPAARIAYLVNQYPKVSHTFIRREIVGLEACGLEVLRFSIRRCPDELKEELDKQELRRTRLILGVGLTGLLRAFLRALLARPLQTGRALWLALRLGRRSDRGILRHLAYLAEAAVLREWLDAAGVEHLHAHFASNPAAVAMLCRVLGGPPFSFTAHGTDDFDRAPYLALDEKLRRAAFAVTVSHYGLSQLCRYTDPTLWGKVQLVRCGVDGSFLAQPAAPVPVEPRLVCLARLDPAKGHLLLLSAVRQLLDEGHACELVLLGDGEMRGVVEEQIRALGLNECVTLAGWASGTRVREQILASRAMVLPSFAENLPLALVESLALGRPVISTYVGAIPELVEPGSCGWLVPAGSVKALAGAMREVLLAPVGVLEKMGRAGAVRVSEQHNAALEAAKLAALFQVHLGYRGDGVA